MKKQYETPVAEKIEFDYQEVVAYSGKGLNQKNISQTDCTSACT